LRDASGERFVDELAPRDVVSRAMAVRMAEQGVEHMWLDATGLESFAERFPTLAASLHGAGLDPATDWLPIAPAAHYLSGGVLTDLDGASALPGLWAAGETACTGVHGANRLASNSLLEGMVFGARLADAIEEGRDGPAPSGVMRSVLAATRGRVTSSGSSSASSSGRSSENLSENPSSNSSEIGCVDVWDLEVPGPFAASPATGRDVVREGDEPPVTEASVGDLAKVREHLQAAMTEGAGVVRSSDSLDRAALCVSHVHETLRGVAPGRQSGELANLADLATAMLRSAAVRTETRGAHARSDHPDTFARWRLRLLHTRRDSRQSRQSRHSLNSPPEISAGAPPGADR